MPTLDLAIATHKAEGIRRVAKLLLPPTEGLRYVVSWQNHGDADLPDELRERDDVDVYRYEGTGLSNNRNNAFEHCSGDIVLITDDDVTLHADGLEALRKAFEEHPEVDFATFRSNQAEKIYPSEPQQLKATLPKGYFVSSIEIAFRRATAGALRCCPECGLGAPIFHGGEDELLLHTALRRGLKCYYFPITINSHMHPSTGIRGTLSSGVLKSSGLLIRLTYGALSLPRALLKARRVVRAKQSTLPSAFGNILRGWFAAPAFHKRNKKYLW